MNYRVDAHEAERHFHRASFTGVETLFHLCPAHQLRPPPASVRTTAPPNTIDAYEYDIFCCKRRAPKRCFER